MSRLSVKTAGLTDQGKVRANNEDAVWADAEEQLMIVADGMGGHKGGEVASGMAITSIPANWKQLTKSGTSGEISAPGRSAATNRLAFCLKMANQMIFEAGQRYPEDSGMGTTCTAAVISDGGLCIAHVGDTRCYLIRRGTIEQLTSDHSLAMDQVRRGLISKEEAAHVNQNILMRSLGTQKEVEIDVDEHPLFAGDALLLCSDGINKELTDDQMLKIVSETADPKQAAKRMIEEANAAGARDNVSVAVAKIEKTSFLEALLRFLGLRK